MRSMDYIGLVFCWIWFVLCALFLIAKKLDMWYSRKEKPKTTDVKCPFDGKKLKDYELFFGHCKSCPLRPSCKGINNPTHVKS